MKKVYDLTNVKSSVSVRYIHFLTRKIKTKYQIPLFVGKGPHYAKELNIPTPDHTERCFQTVAFPSLYVDSLCFRCPIALLPPDANTIGFGCGSVMAVHRGPSTKWLFTRDQLENTPSRRCGIEADRELSYRQQAANLIQDIGQRLNVYPLLNVNASRPVEKLRSS